jgi:hypothetical protein
MKKSSHACNEVSADQSETGGDNGGARAFEGMVIGDGGRLLIKRSSHACNEVSADQSETGGDNGGARAFEGMVSGDGGLLVDEVLAKALTKV